MAQGGDGMPAADTDSITTWRFVASEFTEEMPPCACAVSLPTECGSCSALIADSVDLRSPRALEFYCTMPSKRRSNPPAEATSPDDLVDAVRQLRDEVRVLRESLDEFRTDFVHLLRNLPDNLPPPYQHLTTLANLVESSDAPPD